MEQELSLLIVFAAGLLSFLSPCVLPLIPGYIAFVSGLSIDDMTERGSTDKKMASAMLSSVMKAAPIDRRENVKKLPETRTKKLILYFENLPF